MTFAETTITKKKQTKNETTDILEDGQTDREDDIRIGSGYSSG